jgi:hypothetical protein
VTTSPQKITFGEMRESGVAIYCAMIAARVGAG